MDEQPSEQAELIIDPEFRDLLNKTPKVCDDILDRSLIESNGNRDAIKVWFGHDIILDGHRRYAACQRLGLPFKTAYLHFEDRDEVLYWIDTEQGGRRNYGSHDMSLCHARMVQREIKLEAKRKQAASQGNPESTQPKRKSRGVEAAVKRVAADAGVSERQVQRAREYSAAFQTLPPEIRERIKNKSIKCSQKAVIELSKFPLEHIHGIVSAYDTDQYENLGDAISGEPLLGPSKHKDDIDEAEKILDQVERKGDKSSPQEETPELKELNKLVDLFRKSIRLAADINADLYPSKHYQTVHDALDKANIALNLWKQGAKRK